MMNIRDAPVLFLQLHEILKIETPPDPLQQAVPFPRPSATLEEWQIS